MKFTRRFRKKAIDLMALVNGSGFYIRGYDIVPDDPIKWDNWEYNRSMQVAKAMFRDLPVPPAKNVPKFQLVKQTPLIL